MAAARPAAKDDPRAVRTRKLIEEAFLAVMEAKGFEELSVQDVADRAGINRVTFYAHFVDKYALLGDTIRKSFAAEIETARLDDRALSADAVRDLFVVVCRYLAGLHAHCKPPHLHLDWIVEEQVTKFSAELFVRWADGPETTTRANAGVTRNLGDRSLVAAAASAAMYGLILAWIRKKKRPAPAAFVRSALPIVTRILGIA